MADLTPIRLPGVTDAVYDELRKQILHGRLAPNEQLNLSKLEAALDVSRTPLKIALARLQNEGLVVIHPRRGTYVTEFTTRDIAECYDLRIVLEAHALEEAFEPKNNIILQEIIDLLKEMDTFFRDEATWLDQLIEYMDMDTQMHLRFIDFCGNSRMKGAYEQANVLGYIALMGARFQYSDVQKTQAEHRLMLKALQNHDLEQLLHTARAHLEGAMERAVLRLTEKDNGS